MFFLLSKVVGFFAEPSNLMVTLGVVGALLMTTRFARGGRRLVVAAVLLLALFGLSPLGNALILPLEERFPPADAATVAPAGIVVLGGAVDPLVSGARGEAALNEAAERMTAVVELARRHPRARIVFTGGSANLLFQGPAEAQFAGRLLERLGVAPARLLLESRSRNTIENAILTKALVNPAAGEQWLLVTSAYHMPRAVGIFRRAGFPVEAYPVDWRTRGTADLLRPFSRASEGLRRTDLALREWAGLLAYRLAGHTDTLFPGPLAPSGCDAGAGACRR